MYHASDEHSRSSCLMKRHPICSVHCRIFIISFHFRIKYFEFQDKGVGFDIPKLLTMTDCSICFLFTKFDHFTQKCKSHLPRLKKKFVEEGEITGIYSVFGFRIFDSIF
jgi:hypothetical protein